MIGYVLKDEQADLLVGQEFAEGCFFEPVTDKNGKKFIFDKEVLGCINPLLDWVKYLPLATYEPVLNVVF